MLFLSATRKQSRLRSFKKLHLLGRLGKPEEIASVIVFLLSDDASFMTGSEAIVDECYTA
ncbi:MAG: SDR family oxidoreductase [Nitrososphaeria archaeon]